MLAHVTCQSCNETFEVGEDRLGSIADCPRCGMRFFAQPTAVAAKPSAPNLELVENGSPGNLDLDDGGQPRPMPRIDQVPPFKLFSPGAATLATFLGGPLGGFTILGINFARLGYARAAIISLVVGLVALAISCTLAFVLPQSLPPLLWALPALILVHLLAKSLQGQFFDRHLLSGGQQASNWAAAGIGLGCMVPTLALGAGIGLLMPPFPGKCITFGPREHIYFSDGATEEDARRLGAFFQKEGFFNGGQDTAVQLTRPRATFVLTVFLTNEQFADPQNMQAWRDFRGQIAQEVFAGQTFEVQLFDEWGFAARQTLR